MIQKDRARLLKLIDEVAEIFLSSIPFYSITLQNLISWNKNIYWSKSQANMQSRLQFYFLKMSSTSSTSAKLGAEKQVTEK